jgi:hypothetical protein
MPKLTKEKRTQRSKGPRNNSSGTATSPGVCRINLSYAAETRSQSESRCRCYDYRVPVKLLLGVYSGPSVSAPDESAVRGRADEIQRKLTFGL